VEEANRQKRQRRQDEVDRIEIEGKFRQGKRRFGLGRVMAKLMATLEVVISLTFLVMNLEKILWRLFLSVFSEWNTLFANACGRSSLPT
jgi:hypothetical protein